MKICFPQSFSCSVIHRAIAERQTDPSRGLSYPTPENVALPAYTEPVARYPHIPQPPPAPQNNLNRPPNQQPIPTPNTATPPPHHRPTSPIPSFLPSLLPSPSSPPQSLQTTSPQQHHQIPTPNPRGARRDDGPASRAGTGAGGGVVRGGGGGVGWRGGGMGRCGGVC